METEAERLEAARRRDRPDASDPPAWAMALHVWVSARTPKTRRGRITLAVVAGVAVLAVSIGLLVLPLFVDLSEDRLATLGYGGVFVANLLSTATVFVPVPGLTAVGQALIIQQGDILNPVLVGILGGTGMALGEVTAYAAGSVGSEMVQEEHIQAPRFVRPAVTKIISWIDWLMDHYGFWTLLVLSAVPNPAFELAGITAGASRMNFPRFMVAVLIGKNIRGLLLAFLGAHGVDVPYLT